MNTVNTDSHQETEMNQDTLLSQEFVLGTWQVSPESNQLCRITGNSQESCSLEPRIMLLLCALASRPGKVVRREQLMDVLWPRVIVNENSLTRAISDLRKVFRDDDSISIETVPKTGYRLLAEIRPILASSAPQTHDKVPEQPVMSPAVLAGINSNQGRPLMAMAASMLLGISLTFGFTSLDSNDSNQLPLAATISQEPARSSAAGDLSLSTDSLDAPVITSSLTDQNMAGMVHPGAMNSPVTSPNGELYAFVNYGDTGSSLMLASARMSSTPVAVYSTSDLIYNIQWAPVDNVVLFAQKPKLSPASGVADKDRTSLMMFDIETMAVTVIHGNAAEQDSKEHKPETHFSKLT